jgi:hypothetical protein
MPTKEEIKNFSVLIEELARKLQCSHIEAIVEHCKDTGFEIELASTLVSQRLKSIIRDEALKANLIKREGSKLPGL